MRSLSREIVFKYIFSKLFNQNDEGLFDVLCKDLSSEDKDFARILLTAIEAKEGEYLSTLEKLSISYKLNRIHNADKCTILLGMAELDTFIDTPIPVVIDEAVKIAAKYSTENSTDFVNGILGQYVKERKNG